MSFDMDYWSNDGGFFMADDIDGWKLEAELDAITNAKNPKKYMMEHFPLPAEDRVHDKMRLSDRIATGLLIGAAAVSAVVTFIETTTGHHL